MPLASYEPVSRSVQVSSHSPFQLILGTILFLVCLVALYQVRWIVMASLIGIGLGVIVSPVLGFMRRRLRIPRGLGGALLGLLLLGAAATFTYLLVAMISDVLVPVIEKLPRTLAQLQKDLGSRFEGMPWIEKGIQRVNTGDFLKRSASTLAQGVTLSATAVGGYIFIIALAVYLTVNPDRYLRGLLTAVPAYKRPRVMDVLLETGSVLRRWFAAQLISMLIVGAITALGLWIVGIDSWLAIGLITGLLEFIPFIGPTIAALTAVFITLGSDPDKILWVLGIFVVIQQIESQIVTPLVMKEGVDLPPVQLLIFVGMMGIWLGLLGAFIAPPLFAVLHTVYLKTVARWTQENQGPAFRKTYQPRQIA